MIVFFFLKMKLKLLPNSGHRLSFISSDNKKWEENGENTTTVITKSKLGRFTIIYWLADCYLTKVEVGNDVRTARGKPNPTK